MHLSVLVHVERYGVQLQYMFQFGSVTHATMKVKKLAANTARRSSRCSLVATGGTEVLAPQQ
jgi:hypothetical protein